MNEWGCLHTGQGLSVRSWRYLQNHILLEAKLHMQCRRSGFDPWVEKIPQGREWQPTPVFLPGEFHGQRSLASYNPWGREESDMAEQLSLSFQIYMIKLMGGDGGKDCSSSVPSPSFSPLLLPNMYVSLFSSGLTAFPMNLLCNIEDLACQFTFSLQIVLTTSPGFGRDQ